MRKAFIFVALLSAGPATAQKVSPIDQDVTDKFKAALIAADDKALSDLLSDNVRLSVHVQLGPNGSSRDIPQTRTKAEALQQIHAVYAAVGQPSGAECMAPDGVSVLCQYRFTLPARGMQSMILFDGKKIGGLMIKYGGLGIQ